MASASDENENGMSRPGDGWGKGSLPDRLLAWRGEVVVIDCAHPYVAIGTLVTATEAYVELIDADMHDLRDTTTSRENYLVKTAQYGVGATRKNLVFRMEHVVGISPLEGVIHQ